MFFENFINFFDKFHQKRIIKFLQNKKIKSVIDIGAHKGEFISYLLNIRSINNIHAFEPQPDIFKELKKNFLKNKKIKFNFKAVDRKNSLKKMKINKFTMTSTLSNLNKKSFYFKFKSFLLKEKNSFIKKILVKTIKLDDYFKYKKFKKKILVKIDTEGYEFNVLKGFENNIHRVDFILIENQFAKMYKNKSFLDCHKFLKKKKFKLIKKFIFPTLHFEDRLYKKE